MKLIDFFAGYGGFHKGLEDGGIQFTKTYFSEIDKHAIANYRYNFPKSEYLGAVENVLESGIRADVITFGSPCQDFSLAGKRAGLNGGRSSLIEYPIEYIRRFRPPVFVWENVKGVFSSNGGADFWAIVQAFANIGGYELQWGLTNTVQWLPQNRERIFLVGLAGERSGCEIFPLGNGSKGITERATETPSARCFTAGGNSGGHHSGMTLIRHRSDQPYQAGNIAPTIRNSDKAEVRIIQTNPSTESGGKQPYQQNRVYDAEGVVPALNAELSTGGMKVLQKVGNIYNSKGQNGNVYSPDGISPAISSGTTDDANNGGIGSSNAPKITSGNSIRRLTPTECERLQGLPDGWTKYGNYDGAVKEISDTQRYKLCGNGVSIPPVKAIGEKIKSYLTNNPTTNPATTPPAPK